MADRNRAYEVMGLDIGVDREQIEKRYELLLKKCRTGSFSDSERSEMVTDIDEINKAYRLLTSPESNENEAAGSSPVLRKLGFSEKKAGNFFYYYKYHILVCVLGAIALIYTVYTFTSKPNPDLRVAVMGEVFCLNQGTISKKVHENVPQIKEVSIDDVTFSHNKTLKDKNRRDVQYEYATSLKASALFAAGDIDVIIMDKTTFDIYRKHSVYEKLDNLVKELDVEKEKLMVAKFPDENQEHVYGIEVSSSKFLKEVKVADRGKGMVVIIKRDAKYYDKAVEFIKLLLE